MEHSNSCHEITSIISAFVLFFLMFSPVFSSNAFKYFQKSNEILVQGNELKKMKLINAYLRKINKPFIKSIKSPNNDIIDCVLINLQPAFDLPELKGTTPLDPPELPKEDENEEFESEIKQLWNSNGESCPNGTIPIRRTHASDILRFISTSKFGKKYRTKDIATGHEHALGYIMGGEFYGARARLNVWRPNVVGNGFSLSQIWVIANVPNCDVQTVEAGWHANPTMYNDNLPRMFAFWTPDGYRSGCYNLACSGFVQTNSKISLGATIDPISTYNGKQYEIPFMIWKDPKTGNWWLRAGSELMGYWPQTLFTDLRDHATLLEFGGEVYAENFGQHTSTQMGSGHFPNEGYKKASYVRHLEYVDQHNRILPASNVMLIVDKPGCYDAKNGFSNAWGNYIYFGGPGNNPNCS